MDKPEPEKDRPCSQHSSSSSSSAGRKPSHPVCCKATSDNDDKDTQVNLDTLNPELKSQFDNIKHLTTRHASGLTKLPSNKRE
jgi:hypothetical protein